MDRTPRTLSSALDRPSPVLCLCLTQARTPDIVLIAAASGFDAVYVDLEHSATPLDVTSTLCAAALGAGIVPFVRVPSHDPSTITRVLDGGALGVIAPHVDSPAQAQLIVDACRFPPVGRRTLYGATPVTGYQPLVVEDTIALLDRETIVAPMIESRTSVTNADRIAATEGVDLLLVGAHDLSADLGLPGQVSHPRVRTALAEVGAACERHGKLFGVAGITDPGLLRELVGLGLGFVSAGTDTGLLQHAATARVSEVRRLFDASREATH